MLKANDKTFEDIHESNIEVDSWNTFKKKLSLVVMNKSNFLNLEEPETIVHDDILDLSMVYVLSSLSTDRKTISNYCLRQEDLDYYNKSKDEIFKIAKENWIKNKRIVKFSELSLANDFYYPLLRLPSHAMLAASVPGEKEVFGIIQEEDLNTHKENILVLTSRYLANGASYLFDRDTLKEISDRLNGSFYMISNGRMFLLCVAEDYAIKERYVSVKDGEDDLLDMQFLINEKYDNQDSILSYRIYYYDKTNGSIFSIKPRK